VWYAGASEGKTKLELAAQETMDSWRQQAEKAEMVDHLEFLEIYDGHVEVYTQVSYDTSSTFGWL